MNTLLAWDHQAASQVKVPYFVRVSQGGACSTPVQPHGRLRKVSGHIMSQRRRSGIALLSFFFDSRKLDVKTEQGHLHTCVMRALYNNGNILGITLW